jgi:hypothetical protein
MMYCMILVVGLRGCGGWGSRAVVMVAVGWQLVKLLMVFPFGMIGGKYI